MSPDKRIIYELKPNLSVKFMDAELATNEWGTRGPSFSREKKNGTYRIIGLGDSIMFGWGLPDEQSYLRMLESVLNARAGEPVYEVINTAVPGYNTVMEVEALKEKWLALDPDLVILGYCGNDQDLPNFIRKEHDILNLKECHLLKLVDKYVHPEKYCRSDLLIGAPVTEKNGRFEYDPQDPHPSTITTARINRYLLDYLDQNGYLL